jgi:hypothetical protein
MARRVSPKPTQFNQRHEEQYWHEAQDIAFLAGASLVERDGCTWLLFDDREQLICQPQDSSRIWFETWAKLKDEFPLLTRLWVGGRALTKPGEMEHRKSRDHP